MNIHKKVFAFCVVLSFSTLEDIFSSRIPTSA